MRKVLVSLVLFALAAHAPPEILAADASQAKSAVPPASSAPVPAGSYRLDKAHASLVFRVNHLGFSNYTARFKRFDANLEFDPHDLAASKVVAIVAADSLETDFPDPAKLDFNALLKGAEWLDVASFPTMT